MTAPLAAEARGVSKSFAHIKVLHDVSVSIPVGDARALVGRNGAGKSTLVALLTGIHVPSQGEIRLAGQAAPAPDDRRAWRERVACVYQRWMVIPQLTVAENLFLNNHPKRAGGAVDWRRLRDQSMAALQDWDLDIDPDLEASRLTVEQRQIVEIARALLQGSRFIILDEPTAELERREVNRLFDRIRQLQQNGVTFLYISHHLEEIYDICKTVTVMRDGRVVAESRLSELSKDRLVAAMVGDAAPPASNTAKPRDGARGHAIGLEMRDVALPGQVKAFNLKVKFGECVGLAGLAGSGKEDVAAAAVGLIEPLRGTVLIDGAPAPTGDVSAMRAMGVAFVARDRHVQGLFPLMTLADNLTVTIWRKLGRLGFISPPAQARRAQAQISDLGIVATSGQQLVGELSGGNQQKAMVGRALASEPKVLVLAAPTQGVDIASKRALFEIVGGAKARGMAILIVSDDLDELVICDRVEVIFRGRIIRSFESGWREHEMVAAIEGLD
jgi:simple sugar transport system ATP-binding protein